MKKFICFLAVIASLSAFSILNAQSPQKINYQAVVRNTSDELMKNTGIGMQISILQGSSTGSAVYVERHFPTTSSSGLVTIEIGSGILVSGSFSGINWSSGTYFIKSDIDLNGGATYTISGTSQILSVPFALYSENTNETDPVWTGVSGSYYTKTNIQTAGEAVINASNISAGALSLTNGGTGATTAAAARTNLGLGSLATLSTVTTSEITDGTITSLDIAADAITASDIATDAVGTSEIAANAVGSSEIAADAVTAADIAAGAIGTSEIADGSITTTDVNSIDASKISGLTSNNIPKSNGSSLINGQIMDNGNTVYIGTPYSGSSKLSIVATSTQPNGINLNSNIASASNLNSGIQSYASMSQIKNAGIIAQGYYSNTNLAGVTNYGIESSAVGGGGTNYGLYSSASGGYSVNWAAYFDAGNVHLSNQIEAPNLTSSTGTALVLDASGWIRKSSSDMRLKENITPMQNVLDRVLQLNGVNFTWRADGSHLTDVGFIAQDVQKIFPELVMEDKNDGMLSVKYMNMTAVLTEAIKELHKELEEARKEIAELRIIISASGK